MDDFCILLIMLTREAVVFKHYDFFLQARNEKGDHFDVEIDNRLFTAPSSISIPNPIYRSTVDDTTNGNGEIHHSPYARIFQREADTAL